MLWSESEHFSKVFEVRDRISKISWRSREVVFKTQAPQKSEQFSKSKHLSKSKHFSKSKHRVDFFGNPIGSAPWSRCTLRELHVLVTRSEVHRGHGALRASCLFWQPKLKEPLSRHAWWQVPEGLAASLARTFHIVDACARMQLKAMGKVAHSVSPSRSRAISR